jgi:hypothetical protein
MMLGVVAMHDPIPEDPNNPTDVEIEAARKYHELASIAHDLLARLADIYESGKDIVAPPPNAHYRRFWYDYLERRNHGQAKKSARRR